jgi:hypothetical protein
MIPFKALYGRKCNTPVSWDNPIDKVVIGPELLKEVEEKMIRIGRNLKVSQDKKKSYAKKKRVFRNFKVGEYVFLKVKVKICSIRLI